MADKNAPGQNPFQDFMAAGKKKRGKVDKSEKEKPLLTVQGKYHMSHQLHLNTSVLIEMMVLLIVPILFFT